MGLHIGHAIRKVRDREPFNILERDPSGVVAPEPE
jgi:hypothetical protein